MTVLDLKDATLFAKLSGATQDKLFGAFKLRTGKVGEQIRDLIVVASEVLIETRYPPKEDLDRWREIFEHAQHDRGPIVINGWRPE